MRQSNPQLKITTLKGQPWQSGNANMLEFIQEERALAISTY
jgi:hypothetical protein